MQRIMVLISQQFTPMAGAYESVAKGVTLQRDIVGLAAEALPGSFAKHLSRFEKNANTQ